MNGSVSARLLQRVDETQVERLQIRIRNSEESLRFRDSAETAYALALRLHEAEDSRWAGFAKESVRIFGKLDPDDILLANYPGIEGILLPDYLNKDYAIPRFIKMGMTEEELNS